MSSKVVCQVTQPAPQFKEVAVVGSDFKQISLADYKGKYVVLLFYPLDFTFVCPTEILAFSDRIEDFRKLNTEVIGISVDSKYTHLAWINTPRKEGGLGNINFPLVSDLSHQISKDYDVFLEDIAHSLRGLFIIDAKGILRQVTKNDMPIGRSVDETVRLIQAIQYTDTHGDEVCPVNWKPGDLTMKGDPQKAKAYFAQVNK